MLRKRETAVLLGSLASATIVAVSLATASAVAPNNGHSASGSLPRVQAASAQTSSMGAGVKLQPGDWIVDQPKNQARVSRPNNAVVAAPRKVAPGKYATLLESVLRHSPYSSYRIEELNEYPDLSSARLVAVGSNGVTISLAIQKVTSPISLDEITLGSTLDKLDRLADGTQIVLVNRLMPQESQIVIARKQGLVLTASAISPLGTNELSPLGAADLPSPEQLGSELMLSFTTAV